MTEVKKVLNYSVYEPSHSKQIGSTDKGNYYESDYNNGLSKKELEKMDTNKDGAITEAEFIAKYKEQYGVTADSPSVKQKGVEYKAKMQFSKYLEFHGAPELTQQADGTYTSVQTKDKEGNDLPVDQQIKSTYKKDENGNLKLVSYSMAGKEYINNGGKFVLSTITTTNSGNPVTVSKNAEGDVTQVQVSADGKEYVVSKDVDGQVASVTVDGVKYQSKPVGEFLMEQAGSAEEAEKQLDAVSDLFVLKELHELYMLARDNGMINKSDLSKGIKNYSPLAQELIKSGADVAQVTATYNAFLDDEKCALKDVNRELNSFNLVVEMNKNVTVQPFKNLLMDVSDYSEIERVSDSLTYAKLKESNEEILNTDFLNDKVDKYNYELMKNRIEYVKMLTENENADTSQIESLIDEIEAKIKNYSYLLSITEDYEKKENSASWFIFVDPENPDRLIRVTDDEKLKIMKNGSASPIVSFSKYELE